MDSGWEHGLAATEHKGTLHGKLGSNISDRAKATEAKVPGESSYAEPACKSLGDQATASPGVPKEAPCEHEGSPRCSGVRQRVLVTLACDGYLWLKYGEKMLVQSQVIRAYFKCSSAAETLCMARKTVDFDPVDPLGKAPMLDYTGAHNHEPPAADIGNKPQSLQQAGEPGHSDDEKQSGAQQGHPMLHVISVPVLRAVGPRPGGECAVPEVHSSAGGSASTSTTTSQSLGETAPCVYGSAGAADARGPDAAKATKGVMEMETVVTRDAGDVGASRDADISHPDDVIMSASDVIMSAGDVIMSATGSPEEPSMSTESHAWLDDICKLVGPAAIEAGSSPPRAPPAPHSQASSACLHQEGIMNDSSCPRGPMPPSLTPSLGSDSDLGWRMWAPEARPVEPDDLQSIVEHHAPGILCLSRPLHTKPHSRNNAQSPSAKHKRSAPKGAPLPSSKKPSPFCPAARKLSEASLKDGTQGSPESSCAGWMRSPTEARR